MILRSLLTPMMHSIVKWLIIFQLEILTVIKEHQTLNWDLIPDKFSCAGWRINMNRYTKKNKIMLTTQQQICSSFLKVQKD